MRYGIVFDIQRFCTHDGPGIRTVVFLKGCPLNCWWCHNPESKESHREIFYNPSVCIKCGSCVAACPHGAHRILAGVHEFDRSACKVCMQCADRCFAGAIEGVGRIMSPADVIMEAEKDRAFYDESGGGITLSGGEPMAQFEFSLELLRLARKSGIGACIETSGFAAEERFRKIIPLVDLFFWDIKDSDDDRHRANTGISLAPIIQNLRTVDAEGGRTVMRCILISGVNLNHPHLDGIASIFGSLRHCLGIELMPYHSFGGSKYEKLGITRPDDAGRTPTADEMREARDYLIERWGIAPLEW